MKCRNLEKSYDKTLLECFYRSFVEPRHLYDKKRHERDLEKFETFGNASERKESAAEPRGTCRISRDRLEERTNIILLQSDSCGGEDVFIGGLVFDYYRRVNQVLIRCIVADKEKEKCFHTLLDEAVHSVTLFCKEAGNGTKASHIYLETPKVKIKEKNKTPKSEQILHKLGFCLLSINYHSLLSQTANHQLLVYHPSHTDLEFAGKCDISKACYISSTDLLEFYKEYCSHNLGIDATNLEDTLPWFKQYSAELLLHKEVGLSKLPQTAHKCAQVIVIGAGLAGLAATAKLKLSGLDVVLVEASNYFGGRVKQANPFDGWPSVDLGGEFIEGCNTITYQLAVENNWETELLYDNSLESNSQWVYLDGQIYPYHSTHPDIVASITAWHDFVQCSRHTKAKMNNHDDISAAEYFTKHPEVSKKSVDIFNSIFCQTEASNLDSYGSQEQGDFHELWEYGPGNFRLKGSQELVVNHYLKGCENAEKLLNWQVREIDYTDAVLPKSTCISPYKVAVTNQNGERLQAQAVIVCVPVTVLKDQDILFMPQLPKDKQLAIKRIQMHTGSKITARFSRVFWREEYKLIFNCTSELSQLWMYTNVNRETGEECHVVTKFQTAEYAKQKAHLTAEDVKAIFLNDLDEMFADEENQKPATECFMTFTYYHWSSHPFVRGAYSSPSVHARGSREILARPVQNCVFFAGEATRSGGDSCTISGAVESGIKAAEEVKDIIKAEKKLEHK